ncbi:hypothetical protein H8959_012431 [Pygathrix nigripes]
MGRPRGTPRCPLHPCLRRCSAGGGGPRVGTLGGRVWPPRPPARDCRCPLGPRPCPGCEGLSHQFGSAPQSPGLGCRPPEDEEWASCCAPVAEASWDLGNPISEPRPIAPPLPRREKAAASRSTQALGPRAQKTERTDCHAATTGEPSAAGTALNAGALQGQPPSLPSLSLRLPFPAPSQDQCRQGRGRIPGRGGSWETPALAAHGHLAHTGDTSLAHTFGGDSTPGTDALGMLA